MLASHIRWNANSEVEYFSSPVSITTRKVGAVSIASIIQVCCIESWGASVGALHLVTWQTDLDKGIAKIAVLDRTW